MEEYSAVQNQTCSGDKQYLTNMNKLLTRFRRFSIMGAVYTIYNMRKEVHH